jgi:hypothetical protein
MEHCVLMCCHYLQAYTRGTGHVVDISSHVLAACVEL